MSVMIECSCHIKQSLRNKTCSYCGRDLVAYRRSHQAQYWIRFRDGYRWRLEKIKGEEATSLAYAKDAEAKRRVQKRENRIFEILPNSRMTFQELSNWYLRLKGDFNTRNCLRKFNLEFGHRIVAEITPSEIETYQAKRRRAGAAESTIDQEVGAAKACINKAFNDDLVSGHVWKRFRRIKKLLRRNSNARKRVLSVQEFSDLEAAAPERLKPILRVAYELGMRKGEILKLRWSMVSLKERVFNLPREITKDKEPRTIPIPDSIMEILMRLTRGIHEAPIFTYRGNGVKDFREALKISCERAKIPYGRFKGGGFTFHDIRHTFVTDMRRAGVHDIITNTIDGHSMGSGTMRDRYDTVDLDDLRRGLERLAEYRRDLSKKMLPNVSPSESDAGAVV